MPETLIADRYRLDELLGRTGMSEVWAATDTELGRRVALKLLGPDADTARFEREARAFAALAHPNVTQLYDYGEDQGRPYMVLEYVPDGTLEDRLQGGPLPDEQAWAIASDIAAGLAHAHARGVVHRDLKPLNVLFDEEGRAKIADFGIARMSAGEGTLTEAGTVLGTAAYISPEQAHGRQATPASDVYSFGVILFRMLTGRPPFAADDPLELAMLHRDAEPPPIASYRPDAPPVLETLATASLAKDPRERPRDGAALLAALGVAEGSGFATDEATRVLPPPPPPPPARRRGSALAFAALGVLALAGAALAYALTRPASKPALPPSTTSGSLSLPTTTAPTTSTTASTSTAASTTVPTTTPPPTTVHTTTVHTTAPPPQTTTPPPTTAPPPTTTAPPPTTTAATTT
jgi:eukaryotic-like serine/threonine-protein kinase